MTLAPVLVPLQFCSAIVLIFFLELAVAVLAFLFQDWVRDRFREFFESNIRSYRDDIDLQNLIDSLQKAVSTTWLLPDSAQLSGLQSVCTARGRMANTGSPSLALLGGHGRYQAYCQGTLPCLLWGGWPPS